MGAIFGFAAGCATFWLASRFFCPCSDSSYGQPRSEASTSPTLSAALPPGATPINLLVAESRHREELEGHKKTLERQAQELASRQCTISMLQEQVESSRPRRGYSYGRRASRGHGAGSESEGCRSEPAPQPGRARSFYSRNGMRRKSDIAE